jgi:hypothetical protein
LRTLEGGETHEKMMLEAAEYLKKQGYEVVFKARINHNSKVDVVGIKTGEKIGIECQVIPGWKIIADKAKRYRELSKLILAVPKNVKVRHLMPEGVELMRLSIEHKPMFQLHSISFDDDVAEFVENWRRKQDKIPSFSKAVNDLLRTVEIAAKLDEHEKGEKK